MLWLWTWPKSEKKLEFYEILNFFKNRYYISINFRKTWAGKPYNFRETKWYSTVYFIQNFEICETCKVAKILGEF